MQNGSKVSPKYNRILLKISGESLMGDRQFGLDPSMVDRLIEAHGNYLPKYNKCQNLQLKIYLIKKEKIN